MAGIMLKDWSKDPPKMLAKYELQNGVAVAVVGGETAFVEELEDGGVLLVRADGTEKAVFPEDGEEFLEGLLWEYECLEGVTIEPGDLEGKAIAERYVRTRRDLMASLDELQILDWESSFQKRRVNRHIERKRRSRDAERETE